VVNKNRHTLLPMPGRQHVYPPSPPTLPPEKAIPILEKHAIEAEKLRDELPTHPNVRFGLKPVKVL
jgi:hypothetical protein